MPALASTVCIIPLATEASMPERLLQYGVVNVEFCELGTCPDTRGRSCRCGGGFVS